MLLGHCCWYGRGFNQSPKIVIVVYVSETNPCNKFSANPPWEVSVEMGKIYRKLFLFIPLVRGQVRP